MVFSPTERAQQQLIIEQEKNKQRLTALLTPLRLEVQNREKLEKLRPQIIELCQQIVEIAGEPPSITELIGIDFAGTPSTLSVRLIKSDEISSKKDSSQLTLEDLRAGNIPETTERVQSYYLERYYTQKLREGTRTDFGPDYLIEPNGIYKVSHKTGEKTELSKEDDLKALNTQLTVLFTNLQSSQQ